MPRRKRKDASRLENLRGNSNNPLSKRQKTSIDSVAIDTADKENVHYTYSQKDLSNKVCHQKVPVSSKETHTDSNGPETSATTPVQNMQSVFCHAIKGSCLPSTPDVLPSFGCFSIISEKTEDHAEVDKDDIYSHLPELLEVSADNGDFYGSDGSDSDSDSDEDFEEEIARIHAKYARPDIHEHTIPHATHLPPKGPLKGYDYTPFQPQDQSKEQRDIFIAPTQADAISALKDLRAHIKPHRQTGRGYTDPNIDLWTRARLEGMRSLLLMYTSEGSLTYNHWAPSSMQASIGMGRGRHCARRLREMCCAYIISRKILPLNPFGDWNESMLVDENLRNEISIYLM